MTWLLIPPPPQHLPITIIITGVVEVQYSTDISILYKYTEMLGIFSRNV